MMGELEVNQELKDMAGTRFVVLLPWKSWEKVIYLIFRFFW
jgi:hypothetical protein